MQKNLKCRSKAIELVLAFYELRVAEFGAVGCSAWGLGFRVLGVGVSDLRFKTDGSGLWNLGVGLLLTLAAM